MKFKDALRFAFQDLRKRKGRTFLTSLGIAVGSMLIISMVSLGTSTQGYILNQLKQVNNTKTVTVSNLKNIDFNNMQDMDSSELQEFYEKNFHKIDQKVIEQFATLQGVDLVQPYINSTATKIKIDDKEKNGDFQLIGTNLAYPIFSLDTVEMVQEKKKNNSLTPVKAGRTLQESDKNGILIGEKYVKKLAITDIASVIGKDITITQESTSDPYIKAKPMESTFHIVGVVDENFDEGNAIVMTAEQAAAFQGRYTFTNNYFETKGYDQVKIHVKNADDVKGIVASMKTLDFSYISFDSIAQTIGDAFKQIELVLSILGIIVLVVAGIGIVNTMTMSIHERTKSIGIMKAVGANASNIHTIFITESGVIGLLGGIVGVFMSLIANKIVELFLANYMTQNGFTETISFSPPYWLTLGTLAFSIVVAVFAGFFPARRASKMDPVEALSAK